ncbi:MAG TPA: hypothetical protein VNB06_10445 [Thermoanaerobaculia bacterium]|nr:hypothetical protein [Thermoanaerobaculia bacterium]
MNRTTSFRAASPSTALVLALLAAAGTVAWWTSAPATTASAQVAVVPPEAHSLRGDPILGHALEALERGRTTFRYDPFGSNLFFTEALRLNEVVAQVTPMQALALGLKVDVDNLPRSVTRAIQRGAVDLEDPAVTRLLLSRSAVVGLTAVVEGDEVSALGITCALCHSTVDDSLAPGLGSRLDGWANRDLDVGKILSLAPNLQPFATLLGVDVATVKTVLESWGPGRFDAHLNLDGKAFRPDGGTGAVLIPPAFGLAGVNLHTYNGWGSVPYWNAFVANLEMGGLGTFVDQRLADAGQFPVAAAAGFDDVRRTPDLVTPKLADLHLYQLAIPAPTPPAGSFGAAAAARGGALFRGKADCARCHVPPLYTEPGHNLHTPAEIGIDSFQSDRGPTGQYRTTPLKGLWSHTRGGFYHDGRFATLDAVVAHYDQHFGLGLTTGEQSDLVEFLKSL